MLGYLEKLTLTPDEIGDADVAILREAGVDDQQIVDAVHICAMFNVYDRVADALGWDVPTDPEVWRKFGRFQLARGYEGGKKPKTASPDA